MPRKTTFKKIGRSKQGKSTSNFALESISKAEACTFEFDIDQCIADDTKQKKLVLNPMAYFLILYFATRPHFTPLPAFL